MATAASSSVKLLTSIAIITLLFCLAIGFDVTPFLRGPAPYPPEWQWSYDFVNTLGRLWAPGAIGGALIGSFFLFERKMQNKKLFTLRFLIHIIFITFLLQVSVLYFSRAGEGVLLERIINPGINGYFTTALSVGNIGNFLATYQSEVVHFPMRAADHPPFAVLFFSLILFFSHQLSFLFPIAAKLTIHHSDIAMLWARLLPFQKTAAMISSVLIPVLSLITFIPLYFFTKIYYDEKTAIRTCFLYSIVPSLYLFLPLNDTFLGLFVMTGFLFFLLGQKRNSIAYYFLSGLAFAAGAFFSVSVIVPVGMVLVLFFLKKEALGEKKIGVLGLAGGLVSIPLLLSFFHFNTIEVFMEITNLQAKRSYLPWVFYNLYDFFIFSGIPILIISTMIVKQLVQRKYKDMLAVSFFVVVLLLDISGFSRAETGRIWMPYMPVLTGIIAAFLTQKKKMSSRAFAGILLLQFVQLLVMQEFWVTLW